MSGIKVFRQMVKSLPAKTSGMGLTSTRTYSVSVQLTALEITTRYVVVVSGVAIGAETVLSDNPEDGYQRYVPPTPAPVATN